MLNIGATDKGVRRTLQIVARQNSNGYIGKIDNHHIDHQSVASAGRVRLRIVVFMVNLLPPLTTGLIPISNATSRPN